MTAVKAPARKPTKRRIESLVLELLAAQMGEDRDALKARLKKEGAGMPIDSLEMFDMLAEFRKRTGLTIPVKKLRTDTLRSIGAFADFIVKEAT